MKPHATAYEAWTPDTAIELWLKGYANLIPLIPPGAALAPGQPRLEPQSYGKVPGTFERDGWHLMPGWQSYVASESDVKRWDSWYTKRSSIGIIAGRDSLVLIDIDIMDEELARQACDIVETRYPTVVRRIGQHPKVGLMARIEKSQRKASLPVGDGKIEFLCQGQQFVACGQHPLTRRPYSYPRGLPDFNDLPVLTSDQLSELLDVLEAELPGAGKAARGGNRDGQVWDDQQTNHMLLHEVLELIPNDANFDDRNNWVKMLYAIRGAYGPDHQELAWQAAQAFSGRWKTRRNRQANPRETIAVWESLDAPQGGWRTILWMAKQFADGYRLAEILASYGYSHTAKGEEPFKPADWFTAPPEDEPPPKGAQFKDKRRRFELIDFADFDREPDTPYVVDRLIPDRGVGLFYGESRSFKSFLVADLMLALATDQDAWHGHAITQRGDGVVVYVSGEGVQGMRKRRRAWLKKHGLEIHGRGRLYQVRDTIVFSQIEHIKELIAEIKNTVGDRPIIGIVIDTVARAMFGMDENTSKDFGLFTLSCETLRDTFDCFVLGVHHANKKGDMRGSTAMIGNNDCVFRVERSAEQSLITTLTCDKLKDDEDGWYEVFQLERVEDSLVPVLTQGGKMGDSKDKEPDPEVFSEKVTQILVAMLRIGDQWMKPQIIAETMSVDSQKVTVGQVRGLLNYSYGRAQQGLLVKRGEGPRSMWSLTMKGREAAATARGDMFG